MRKYKEFVNLLVENINFKDDPIFDGYKVEVSRKTTSRTTVLVIRSTDRDSDRDIIGSRLQQKNILFLDY